MLDLLTAPRCHVVQEFTSILTSMEDYARAVECLRAHHTGVAMFGSALKILRERLADPTSHPLELLASYHIAREVQTCLHRDVVELLKAEAHD